MSVETTANQSPEPLEEHYRDAIVDDAYNEKKHLVDVLMAAAAKRAASSLARKQMAEIPGLSISSIITNLRILGTRAATLSTMQQGPALFFSWQNPALTLSGLVVYTMLCHRPYLLSCVPVFLFLTQILIPNYAQKYPIDPSLLPSPVKPPASEFEDLTDQDLVIQHAKEHAERDVLLALRQGQQSLAKLVEGLEKFDAFRAGPANFVDPSESSVIFLIALAVLVNTAVLTSFVPLTSVFVSVGWIAVVLKHPWVKKKSEELGPLEFSPTVIRDLIVKLKPQFFVRDKPLVREVEIFELQRQGLTPRLWDSILFSPYMYVEGSAWRRAQQLPPGAKRLADVISPEQWHFDEADPWRVCKTATDWISERQVHAVQPDGQWANDLSSDWRRRRWVRRCYHSR